MDNILEKLSSYNVFTNLFPGVVFCYLADRLFNTELIQDDILVGVFAYYFIGMVISRVGSLVVGGLIASSGLVKYADYSSYVAAENKDPKLQILLETSNSYRSVVALIFCLGITGVWVYLSGRYDWIDRGAPIFILGSLFAIFLFAYRKQTNYIVSRVNYHPQADQAEPTKNDG